MAEFCRFPGIGRRSAERMALDLLVSPDSRKSELLVVLQDFQSRLATCPVCGYVTEDGICPICSDKNRDQSVICVVETFQDALAFEKSRGISGLYHILGGRLSPLKGIGPKSLSFEGLMKRVAAPEVQEIIIATSPTVEGDATGLYLAELLADTELTLTRLGRGLPMGGTLEFTDESTLRMALESRQKFQGNRK